MRNERWVYRFLFAWNDTLFFDPLDVFYEPNADHFLAAFDERVRARFVRSGIWWSFRHNQNLPAQGWKIHISSSHRHVREVATSVIGHLTEREIDFKIALDLNIFEMLNSKAISRGSGGKLVTVYPRDDDEFRTCLADLARLLKDVEGAYVLSDLRYRDSKASTSATASSSTPPPSTSSAAACRGSSDRTDPSPTTGARATRNPPGCPGRSTTGSSP